MWKQIIINDIKTNYSVNELGQVQNNQTGKILKGTIQKGYRLYTLYIQKKPKAFGAHRLVALMFIPNLEQLPYVNHKDGNPLNNKVSNLEWCTPKYNTQHAIKTGLKKNFNQIAVIKYSKTGEKMQFYLSLSEAAEKNSCSVSKIIEVCKGRRKTTGGYQWRYASDNIERLNEVIPNPQKAKPVAQINPITNEVINIYPTLHAAAQAIGGTQSAITHVLKGDKNTKTHKGYKWKLVEEIVQ